MELPVVIINIIYRNENGFAILSAKLDIYSPRYNQEMEKDIEGCVNEKYGTFVIITNMMSSGENPKGGQYIFVGNFVFEKKYNCKQFKSEFYYQDKPTTEDGLLAFLCSLPNIKESRSRAILDKFGVEGTIEILDNNIYKLTEINGITEKRIPPIQKVWDDKKHLRELYAWLTAHKISTKIADGAYKLWGKETLSIIQKNPYRIVELRGIGFITADKIAHQINKDLPLDYRVTACIKYILEEAVNTQSNLCIPYSDLKKSLMTVLAECDENLGKKVDLTIYVDAAANCLKNNLSIFTIVKDLQENRILVSLHDIWKKEFFIAKSIYDRKTFNHVVEDFNEEMLDEAEKNISSFGGKEIILDETQKEAIKSAFEHKITIITGAGGTGKSTICRCIFYIAQKLGLTVRMMSPTGKAAQVLTEKTGCGATTIHRGLKMKPGDNMPRENIKEDVLLIDEISMSGLDTMYAICQALVVNKWANIVFVGDKNQLPSVSPGNFLSDIIESGCANIVTLNKIHRQDENSYISLLANEISKGKVVEIPEIASDIKWHPLNTSTLYDELMVFIDSYLISGKDIDDLQIISPMKKGICGVYKLNEIMQGKMAQINRTTMDFISIGFRKFHKGDRVIQLENDYDKMVFNGDMGVIEELGEKVEDPSVNDKKEKYIVVKFIDQIVYYWGAEIEQLQLAWAITVHKFQGSQSKYVVFIMADEQQIMMNKELVYTAFTRAEKQLDIFGHNIMLRLAPTRSSIRKRFTNFKKIIDELRSNQKILRVMEKQEEPKK